MCAKNTKKHRPTKGRCVYARGATLLPSKENSLNEARTVNVLLNVDGFAPSMLEGSKINVVFRKLAANDFPL